MGQEKPMSSANTAAGPTKSVLTSAPAVIRTARSFANGEACWVAPEVSAVAITGSTAVLPCRPARIIATLPSGRKRGQRHRATDPRTPEATIVLRMTEHIRTIEFRDGQLWI